ncbi:MAG TPA: ATP-grasp domain-containing protein [Gaiellaceae bacterium]
MRFAVVAHQQSETNRRLVAAGWPGACAALLTPREALLKLEPGDVALVRLDVAPDLDGVEEGLWIAGRLEAHGIKILNRPSALLAAHDKLVTARLLSGAGIPHPHTRRLSLGLPPADLEYPLVAKPRFGSWGRDVELCADAAALERYLARTASRTWWRAGAIAQALVRPQPTDLRLVVAGGRVVGAAVRTAAPGEWRTNVALGGRSDPTVPTPEACVLGVAAATALGLDLAGVDLLHLSTGVPIVIEVNGSVDFKPHYALGEDVFDAAATALAATLPSRVAA